ncbi:aldo/keto reductase [Streptomyces yaanensis]|uniref:Aldo/keto reductase n=1 Tax=Streptomyces yaanensis TaxID=1142239 RepID=A0ABV7SFG9_9ACTN|nr:aldo/keto reductase [Streptomyces sp. CGMCC 4.7035]WNB98266.1 aldo/keto reductase [Streptomyces sp. CGMCC 4.7035]
MAQAENSAPDAARSGRWTHDSGLGVNRIGFGAMQLPGLGVWGPPADRDNAIAVVRRAVELGVDHIDTADYYGPHVANELIREALHPYADDLVIGTKVGVVRGEDMTWPAAASPAQLRNQVEENLKGLGRDYLDIVYLRVGGDFLLPAGDTPMLESFQSLAELRDKGLIRHLGLSTVDSEQLAQAQQIAPVTAVENRFNVLDRRGGGVLQQCEQQGIAFVPYFPLGAGTFTKGHPMVQEHPSVDAVAERHGVTVQQVAIAWLLYHSPAILPIPGTSSLAHLEDNIKAADIQLTAEDVHKLDTLEFVSTLP